jgi:hypothetical protein
MRDRTYLVLCWETAGNNGDEEAQGSSQLLGSAVQTCPNSDYTSV